MKEMDDLRVVRSLYAYCRRHPTPYVRSMARVLYERGDRTTFIVNGRGEALPYGRPGLIADLRILLIRAGLPVGFVARWDRTDN